MSTLEKSIQSALMESGASLHESACHEHVKNALDNGYIGIVLQRSGGQALPSTIEKDVADTANRLSGKHSLVFRNDVMKLAIVGIEETVHASYFPDGKLTRGWYNG